MTKDEASKLHQKINVLYKLDGNIWFGSTIICEDNPNIKIVLPKIGECLMLSAENMVGVEGDSSIFAFKPLGTNGAIVLHFYEQ